MSRLAAVAHVVLARDLAPYDSKAGEIEAHGGAEYSLGTYAKCSGTWQLLLEPPHYTCKEYNVQTSSVV
jgi:hypothetical protein